MEEDKTTESVGKPTPDYGEPWDFDGENWITDMGNQEVLNLDSIHSRNAKRLVACVNACAGMADPAADIQAMRKAIKEAWIEIQYAEAGFAGLALRVCPNDSTVESILNRMTEALSKLQPFVTP